MSKKIISLLAAFVIMAVTLSGCAGKDTKRGLSSLAIVIGLAIDKSEGENQGFETFGEEKNKILMTTQVVRNDSVGQQESSQQGSGS